MITVAEAFKKFSSRLELTKGEQDDASKRQKEIREHLRKSFNIEHDFLTGSYARWTKTKPLKDVDIFCELGGDDKQYRDKDPSVVLGDFRKCLAKKYGESKLKSQRRSVTVDFDVAAQDDRVMSFDVVPAFKKGDHYEIPDTATSSGWTETDPRVHADKATAANKAFSGEWKRIVRMTKKWNEHHGKPVKPSFLIEVMSIVLINPPFGGDYRREMKTIFSSLADRIDETWPDPAGLGPDVSDSMDSFAQQQARSALLSAEELAAKAIRLEREGKTGEALRVWRNEIFGDLFPLS
ncbi:CBASS oligonucleotide cyclase [Rhodopirellula bahusiensis]|uniref:CBASS oligonucleotide cyclase n=1 Tax=Rhodopirellula bahusiensis TaxID=2014065 RepID=UPI0032649209